MRYDSKRDSGGKKRADVTDASREGRRIRCSVSSWSCWNSEVVSAGGVSSAAPLLDVILMFVSGVSDRRAASDLDERNAGNDGAMPC